MGVPRRPRPNRSSRFITKPRAAMRACGSFWTAPKGRCPPDRSRQRSHRQAGGSHGHQGVAARVEPVAQITSLDELLENLEAAGVEQPLLLVLDGVTDPHNLGACLRVADGAGAHAVIAPKTMPWASTPPWPRWLAACCGNHALLHGDQPGAHPERTQRNATSGASAPAMMRPRPSIR